jgi:hypothetical protein
MDVRKKPQNKVLGRSRTPIGRHEKTPAFAFERPKTVQEAIDVFLCDARRPKA